ncbi:MAG: MFS transporter [Actinomycetota bacterium]
MVASTVGTSLEWYDFFLYGTVAALVFPELFFPNSSSYVGVLEAFATFAVGFAARPVGAAIFGHYGDRIGRRNTLIVTLLLMGAASVAIGLLPTAASIGAWAAILLVCFRIVQGIGVGGEWGGSVLLAMEWSRSKRRGFVGSLPQLGVPIGLLLSTGVVALTMNLTGDAFDTWGWRIPFLISFLLVLIGLVIRLKVDESPEFLAIVAAGKVERKPVTEVVRRHPREIVLTALMRLAEQTPFYLFTAFVLAYGTEELGLSRRLLLAGTMVAAALALFTVPFFGWLSDVVGRKRLYVTGAGPDLLEGGPLLLVAGHAGAGDRLRRRGVLVDPPRHDVRAAGRPDRRGVRPRDPLQRVLAGVPVRLGAGRRSRAADRLAWLLHTFDSGYAIAGYIMVSAAITIAATLMMKERPTVEEPVVVERAPIAVGARAA